MSDKSAKIASMVFSADELRKAIGYLGIALPVILALGGMIIFDKGLQGSISGYYHTGMRDVFVGIICVIGFFLFSYRGYEWKDSITGDFACFFAVGLALLPTAPEIEVTARQILIGNFHLSFATLFFATLIYFALGLFTKTSSDKKPSEKKLKRNKVYKACGFTMSACILMIAFYKFLPDGMTSWLDGVKPIFWLEAIAIEAFGVSWIVKGRSLLAD